MSYNIVKKGGSTVLVQKYRDHNNNNKVVEKYLLSMGVQTDAQHKEIRRQVNELAQEDRIKFCQHSGLVVEVKEDIPRRKAPTGDIREPTPKKERKTRKVKAKVVKEVVKPLDMRPTRQSVVLKREAIAGMPVRKYKTLQAKKTAITSRIKDINAHITDQAIYLKHYKSKLGGLSKSEHQMRTNEAERYQTYKVEGTKAIKILQKQRSELKY